MSKKKDIVNEIQGSIGDFVIYKRYGKTFLRSRPKTMNHPNSDAQLEQRHKFSMSNTLAKNYRAAVGHVSVETDEPKSPYNSMIGLIRRTGFKGKYPDITWNWETLEFSEGSLALPKDLRISETESHIQLDWNNEETKEQGTVFLISVNPETLNISVATDTENSGSLSLEKAEGQQYFAFKEWINDEKTLKSSTKRYLQNSETPVVDDKPIELERKEILTKSEEIHDDEMESVRGLDDDSIEISFDPSEFGDFSSYKQNEEIEIESETESDEVLVGTLGIVEPEIVYNPEEFTDFEKLESSDIKEEAFVQDSTTSEVTLASEELEELVEDSVLESEEELVDESVSELETEEVSELEVQKDLVEDVVDESDSEQEIVEELVNESEVDTVEDLPDASVVELISEIDSKYESADVLEIVEELENESEVETLEGLMGEPVAELVSELESKDEPAVELETVQELGNDSVVEEIIERVEDNVIELSSDEPVETQEQIEDKVSPEPEVQKEESAPVQKAEKEKNTKKTLVEKAITSKEDEMRNQLSLF